MAQHKIFVAPQSTSSPNGGGTAWSSINTSGGSDSNSCSSNGSTNDTARWFNFSTNFQGMGPNDIQLLRGTFGWSGSGDADGTVNTDGTADAGASITGDILGGVSGGSGFSRSCGISITGPGPTFSNDSFSDSGTETGTFTPNTLASITGAQCIAESSSDANATFDASSNASVSIGITNPLIEVTLTDWMVIAC